MDVHRDHVRRSQRSPEGLRWPTKRGHEWTGGFLPFSTHVSPKSLPRGLGGPRGPWAGRPPVSRRDARRPLTRGEPHDFRLRPLARLFRSSAQPVREDVRAQDERPAEILSEEEAAWERAKDGPTEYRERETRRLGEEGRDCTRGCGRRRRRRLAPRAARGSAHGRLSGALARARAQGSPDPRRAPAGARHARGARAGAPTRARRRSAPRPSATSATTCCGRRRAASPRRSRPSR